jgi:putative ABC transport system substrate-binding protein
MRSRIGPPRLDRRTVLAGLASIGAMAPARAQLGGVPRVGFMGFATAESDAPSIAAFREGMREQGLVEGQSLVVEPRHAGGDVTVAARMIDELVRLPVAAFIAPGPAAVRSIKRVTTIPIVAVGLPPAGDAELFATVSRPGGSVTGFSTFGEDLSGKRIEILREVFPHSQVIGILHNAADPIFRDWGLQTETAIRNAGLTPARQTVRSTSLTELAEQFSILKARGADAVIVIRDFLTHSLRADIVKQAHALGISVVAEQNLFVEGGALLSYGPDIPDLFRRSAGHIGRILRGTPPGDIPIEFPIRFELALNLNTARAFGIAIPQTILARADEVID